MPSVQADGGLTGRPGRWWQLKKCLRPELQLKCFVRKSSQTTRVQLRPTIKRTGRIPAEGLILFIARRPGEGHSLSEGQPLYGRYIAVT